MGIMKQLTGLSKKEKEKAHNEYLEIRNRLKETQAQVQKKPIKRRKSNPRNGKVTTYNINNED